MRRSGLLLLCASLLALFASLRADWLPAGPQHGERKTEIAIRQTAAGVDFEFSRVPGGAHGRIPYRCGLIIVYHYDEVIWFIATPGILPGEAKMRYGVVPTDFEQIVPRSHWASPPPLEFGNKYGVSSCAEHTTFIYEGAPRKAK
jgi:hypothetical protein